MSNGQQMSMRGVDVGRGFASLLFIASLVTMKPAAAASCDNLKTLRLAETTIDEVTTLESPQIFRSPRLSVMPDIHLRVPVCRVLGTIKPSPTSDIKFAVWMPEKDWNGRYQQIGNGGLAGSINDAFIANVVSRGYAAAATDDGTAPPDSTEWLSDLERVADYGHRAVHATTVNAKALIMAFYGKPAEHSYFLGASKGGQEAMMEAQRYPADFDGIISHMPAFNVTGVQISMLWNSQAMLKTPESLIPENKLQTMHDAVIAACIDRAGVKGDDYLVDPPACAFEPADLLCKANDLPSCLTLAQVETAKAIYRGPHNPRTGEMIYTPQVPGSEGPKHDVGVPGAPTYGHGWVGYQGTLIKDYPIPIMANAIFRDPKWDWRSFDFDHDVQVVHQSHFSAAVDATDPNLEPFRARGGKLIMTQGWHDPLVPPLQPIRYYEEVIAHQGKTGGSA